MKTKGMKHQIEALKRMAGQPYYGLLMEQGTGKTWSFLADCERLFAAGKIDCLCIIAPNGVHTNWILREIPKHLEVPRVAYAWDGKTTQKAEKERAKIFVLPDKGEVRKLRILAINYDATIHPRGFEFVKSFLRSGRSYLVLDESSRIKSPPKKAARTDAALRFAPLASVRRIGTGTPITRAPQDIFYQFEFLESALLGTGSFRAFVAEYTKLLDKSHPLFQNIIAKNPRAQWAQIPERDAVTGRPIFRNLDKLAKLIEAYSYRVLKSECLDLPPKTYKTIYFQLTSSQLKAYKLMEKQLRMELSDGSIDVVQKLNMATKLQQITSGFLIDSRRQPFYVESEGLPRLQALKEIIDNDSDRPFVIWASYREELKHIAETLRKAGRRVVEYHGAIPQKDRDKGLDDFMSGKADDFLGHAASGGLGLTLVREANMNTIFYSNTYNREHRWQAEDRTHRIGSTGESSNYYDILGEGTIDEIVYDALLDTRNLAATLLNDLDCLSAARGAF